MVAVVRRCASFGALVVVVFALVAAGALARSSGSASTNSLLPHAPILSGRVTLFANRASNGLLQVRATYTVTLKPRSHHRPPRSLAADLDVSPCNGYLDPLEIPFTGPTVEFVGADLEHQLTIPGRRKAQRLQLTGTVSSNMSGGVGPVEDPNWTDCALADLYVGGQPVFVESTLVILTVTNGAGQRVSYPTS
jgi:hypothetical protein